MKNVVASLHRCADLAATISDVTIELFNEIYANPH